MKLTNDWVDLTFANDVGAGDGSSVNLVTSNGIKSLNTTSVYVNGILKINNVHYSINISTDTVTFYVAPALGQIINVRYATKA